MEHYLIVLEPSATGYAAFSPDVPGCIATGATVEQTLSEMRGALAFHFEGMTAAGELLLEPKGLEHLVQNGGHIADPGDLLTTIPADELLPDSSLHFPSSDHALQRTAHGSHVFSAIHVLRRYGLSLSLDSLECVQKVGF